MIGSEKVGRQKSSHVVAVGYGAGPELLSLPFNNPSLMDEEACTARLRSLFKVAQLHVVKLSF